MPVLVNKSHENQYGLIKYIGKCNRNERGLRTLIHNLWNKSFSDMNNEIAIRKTLISK